MGGPDEAVGVEEEMQETFASMVSSSKLIVISPSFCRRSFRLFHLELRAEMFPGARVDKRSNIKSAFNLPTL